MAEKIGARPHTPGYSIEDEIRNIKISHNGANGEFPMKRRGSYEILLFITPKFYASQNET